QPGVTNFTMSTMKIVEPSLAVSNSHDVIGQSIAAGTVGVDYAAISLDATASGEDIRVTSIPIDYTYTGNANDLSGCYIRDLNNGTDISAQNIVSPSANNPSSGSAAIFKLWSGGLIVPQGTSVTVELTCDLSHAAVPGSTYH